MPAGFPRTNWQSLNTKYIDCEIQISRHCHKSASEWFGKHSRQMRFAQAVQAIRHQIVHLRFKQRLQRSLEVSTGQYPPVKRPSETLSERELNSPTSVFANSTRTAVVV